MDIFSKFNDRVMKLTDFIVGLLMTTLLILIFFQVLNRFVLHIPAAWTEEMGRYSFVWLSLFGAVKALKSRAHLSVDVLVLSLGPRLKSISGVISDFMTLLFSIILVKTGLSYTIGNIGVYCEFGEFPVYAIYLAIPIAGLLLCLVSIEQLFSEIKGLMSGNFKTE